MTTNVFHPAIVQLLRLQGRGRRRRMWARFRQPRRLVLSAVACVLAVLWLGNAAMTVWLRETATPETLRALLSLGLVFYASWHFAKAAFFRPENPLDWTPAQRELLAEMPLRSRDLVAYQLASVTVTTVLKAGLFTLLLLPDLRCLPLGLVSLLLVMLSLELLRVAIDIATWGMGQAAYFAYRATVVLGLIVVGLALGADIVRENASRSKLNIGEGIRQRILEILIQSNDSVLGYLALPFKPFIDLVLAERMTPGNVGLAVATLAAVTVLAAAVVVLYTATTRGLARREKRNYQLRDTARTLSAGCCEQTPGQTSGQASGQSSESEFRLRLARMPRCGGAGALAWRQLLGARRHWGSLLTAMIAPAVLACFPGFGIANPHIAFQTTTGTLAFYTFLLLPTALRFDFHRDLERLATLKGLPIRPSAAALGQTLAPVLIATVFQVLVLAFVIVVRSLPPYYLLMAMLVLIPINVLVFGLDNLIFLLYPYRLQQEGLEIFLRTMLTFTGKGLLFILGLVAMSSWGLTAAAAAHGASRWSGSSINAYAVFLGGMFVGLCLLAAVVLRGLCRVYRNMNPIEDAPR